MYIDLDRMKAFTRRAMVGEPGATFAPAMGLIGTLIGLVQMLQNMSDPNTIGPAMAVVHDLLWRIARQPRLCSHLE